MKEYIFSYPLILFKSLKKIFSIFLFTFLMIVASNLKIYLFFTPVPITLQTFVLFLSLIFLKKYAFFVQALYLFLGIMNVPVFSQYGAGVNYLFGPSGGYLFSFLLISLFFPYFLQNKKFTYYFLMFSLANFIIYFFGLSWLIFLFGISFKKAFILGVLPFLWGDILKIILAALFGKKYAERI